jgi:hypothetical protein
VVQEIHLQLVHLKEMLVVVDVIKVAYIMLLVVEVVQLRLVVLVGVVLVQDLQDQEVRVRLLLLQQVLSEEQVEEMVVVMFLYEIRHQLVLVEGVMVQQEQLTLVVEVEVV